MTLATAMALAQEAKELATKANSEITSHEELCANRYLGIQKTLGLILKVLGWGGVTLLMTMIGAIGWFLAQQSDNSKTQVQTLQLEIQALHDRAPPAR